MRRSHERRAPRTSRGLAFSIAFTGASLLAPTVAFADPANPPAAPVDPNPAKLSIDAPSGAEIRIDDVLVGTVPLAEPIKADPGKHRILVTANGNHPYATDVVLARGKTTTLEADLESTTQRTASWILISTGATAVAVGVGFGVASVIEHRRARDLEGGPDDVEPDEQAEYDAAISNRDDYRVVSGVLGGAGLATFVTGAILYAFDAPDVPDAPDAVGFTLVPVGSPAFAGAIATLRY